MSVYIVAQLKLTDHAAYKRYQARFAAVFRKFQGRLLAADGQPQVLEGQFERDKIVVLEFPDKQAAAAFQTSPEYTEIAADRRAGAEALILLVRGWDRAADKIRAIDAWALTQAPH